LYAQASEALRNLVKQGGYAHGDRLPSEIELSRRLGISRPTLREALHQLEEDGVIVRRHGVGTFVAAGRPVIDGGLEVLESIDRMADRCGLATRMDQAQVEQRMASVRELRGLNLVDETPVTVVTRVILAEAGDGLLRRVAYLADVVPVRYLTSEELLVLSSATGGAQDTQPAFNGSVLDLFLLRSASALSHSRTELIAEVADSSLARKLHIKPGAPLLKLDARLIASDGSVIDFSTSHFVPGFFRFHVVRRIEGA
jgi:GntR family transcriptional regulator